MAGDIINNNTVTSVFDSIRTNRMSKNPSLFDEARKEFNSSLSHAEEDFERESLKKTPDIVGEFIVAADGGAVRIVEAEVDPGRKLAFFDAKKDPSADIVTLINKFIDKMEKVGVDLSNTTLTYSRGMAQEYSDKGYVAGIYVGTESPSEKNKVLKVVKSFPRFVIKEDSGDETEFLFWVAGKGSKSESVIMDKKTDVQKIIKVLGDTDWGNDNEAQMKAVQLLKGIALSDDPMSNEFMKALSDASTGIAKRVLGGKKESLTEAKGPKPSFGNAEGDSYAVLVSGLDSNDFYKQPFGRQLGDLRKIQEFMKTAKKGYVGAKGKSTMASVKLWVKENKPSQFYAKWKSDSSSYKDDSVEIYYVD